MNHGQPAHAARDVSLAIIADLFAEERSPQARLGRDDLYVVLQDHSAAARRQIEHQRPALLFDDDGRTERNRRALLERVNRHPLNESQVGSELLDPLSLPTSDIGLLERARVLVVLWFRFFVGPASMVARWARSAASSCFSIPRMSSSFSVCLAGRSIDDGPFSYLSRSDASGRLGPRSQLARRSRRDPSVACRG